VAQLEALADVASNYRVVLLSDEIYGELHHKGQHVSIAKFYPEGTIVSSGLSKWCGAGGWRLGTFLFPPSLYWLKEAMAVVASETYTSTSAPIQYAAVRAFNGCLQIEEYLAQSRRILSALGQSLGQRLRQANVKVPEPQGAFYLFPDFSNFREEFETRGVKSSRDFCESLLESTGVAVLPGSSFGRAPDELTARLAYVDFDGARALAAALQVPLHEELDQEFLRYYCSAPMKAIDRICNWVQPG
jgi:aspartate aminotransferase